jgi:uncharacterized protein (DUF433 family)
MSARIIDNRIAGTRITIWDVLHYADAGWTAPEIAQILRVSEAQVSAAYEYIDARKDEVMSVHREIEERNASGNSPEIEEKQKQTHAKVEAWLNRRGFAEELIVETCHARHTGGC